MKRGLRAFVLAAVAAILLPAQAEEEVKTEWIEPVAGFRESALGARLGLVETLPDDQGTRVTIEIPREAIADTDDIHEIVVTGRGPGGGGDERELSVRHQWVSNYDEDHYGLLLYLGGEDNLPLRLYFKAD